MNMELNKNVAEDLSVLSPPRTFDDSIGGKVFQVQYGEDWVEVTMAVFRSWTGLRRVNGDDYHGPVYNFGTVEDLKPYSEARSCGCNICQAHIKPYLKKN